MVVVIVVVVAAKVGVQETGVSGEGCEGENSLWNYDVMSFRNTV